jgi:hypothetical protein
MVLDKQFWEKVFGNIPSTKEVHNIGEWEKKEY